MATKKTKTVDKAALRKDVTLEQFKEMIGGRNACVMECETEGASILGKPRKIGDTINLSLAGAYAKFKSGHWKPTGAKMVESERQALNKALKQQHEMESGKQQKISKR